MRMDAGRVAEGTTVPFDTYGNDAFWRAGPPPSA
jgi:hypothetical protein